MELTFSAYYLLSEANLFKQDKLLADIDQILVGKDVSAPEIKGWFHNHYLKWYLSKDGDSEKRVKKHIFREGEPEWANRPDIVDFQSLTDAQSDQINHFIDYFLTLPVIDLKKINKEPYQIILNKVKQWDAHLAKQMQAKPQLQQNDIDIKTLFTFSDGFRVVKLLTKQAFKQEGDVMGHCVAEYYKSHGEGNNKNNSIFSLRDLQGAPHVTLELRDGSIVQVRGKENKPPIEKYLEYVKTFLKETDYPIRDKRLAKQFKMISWDGNWYFPDSKAWKKVYTEEIYPRIVSTTKLLNREDPLGSMKAVKKIPGYFVIAAFAKVFPPVSLQIGKRFALKNKPAIALSLDDPKAEHVFTHHFKENLQSLKNTYDLTFGNLVYIIPTHVKGKNVMWSCFIEGKTPSGRPVVFAKKPGYMSRNTLYTSTKVINGYMLLGKNWRGLGRRKYGQLLESFKQYVKS